MGYKLKRSIVEEYLRYRLSRVKSHKSHYWIQKAVEEFLKFSNHTVTKEKIMEFQNWYKANYGYETQCKYHNNLRNFLEWLSKKTGNPEFREMREILEPPKKNSKKLNPILIREPDIHNLLIAVWNSALPPLLKLKYIAGILFAAYTGQMPESTTTKLTAKEFREAVERNPPLIYVPEEKDKENFPHWVPLHPVVVEWLKAYLEVFEGSDDEPLFSYYSMRKMFDRLDVKAVHTGKKIAFSHLRKFFEQMCNNVLMVHPGLRDYIMAHNTGSLDVQSYDGKLPVEIYEQYMAAWGEVNLVPEEVRLEELLKYILT